jgi:hypothetical protein
MLNVYNGNNTFIMTLTEKCLLPAPNYIFRFIHRTTNAEFKFVKLNADDTSQHKSRYNQFTVASSLFPSVGQYVYEVYETTGTSTDISGKNQIESGIAIRHESDITYVTRAKNNEFIFQ